MPRDFSEVLASANQAVGAACADAVRRACEDLLRQSRNEVPYDQGDLSNSGKVTVVRRDDEVEGAVSFDTPYAVVQHEDPTLQHQDGRKAKYLGDPLRENAPRYHTYVANRVRRNLK